MSDTTLKERLLQALDTKYEFDYDFNNATMKIIDMVEIDNHKKYLVRYEMDGDMTKMPGIFTTIEKRTENDTWVDVFEEVKNNIKHSSYELELDQFPNITEESKLCIKSGTAFKFSFCKPNGRSEYYSNPVSHITSNILAQIFNIIEEDDDGKIDILIHSKFIEPPWKR